MQGPQIHVGQKGCLMVISLTAIYIAGTVALIMAGFVAAAVQD